MNKAECLTARFDALSDVFYDPDRLIRHLSVMKYNTQLEWFNLALIADNEYAAENGFRLVLSEEEWKANEISFPLKGKGIPLLFPLLQGNKLSWVLRNLYTVGDFGFEEPANENSIPSILNTYESNGAIQDLYKVKGDSWPKECFQSYLKSREIDTEGYWHSFLLAALELTWGSNLRIRSGVRKKDLCLKTEKTDPLEMYHRLASVITGFPRYFMLWMEQQRTDQSPISDLANLTLQKIRGVRR